jgi:GNAT superfamily N-acetyltransferase
LLTALPQDRGLELWVFGPWTPDSPVDVLGGEFIERRWYHTVSRADLRPFNADTARRLGEEDAELVKDFGDTYAWRVFKEFRDGGCEFFGVTGDDGLLSFAMVRSDEQAIVPEVTWVSTRESCRGRGLGKAVVSRAAAETLADVAVMMYGGVAEGNVASMRLCRSIGFRAVGYAAVYHCGPRSAL